MEGRWTPMQRIKLEVFKKFFKKDLTGNEIDFLIALTYVQDNRGIARGVFYRDMMAVTGMSTQAFYDCKRSLEEKGVISVQRKEQDYDITLIGNDFSGYTEEDYRLGNVKYIRTNMKLFRDTNWKKLKPAQKLLVMDLVNINTASNMRTYRIARKKFVEKYTELLQVTGRTLQKYMKFLKLYFYVGLKEGMYYITLRKQFCRSVAKTESDQVNRHLLDTACRRNRIKEPDEREAADILTVISRYRKEIRDSFCDVVDVFGKMLEVLNANIPNRSKWKRRLKASLYHKLLREELGLA